MGISQTPFHLFSYFSIPNVPLISAFIFRPFSKENELLLEISVALY